MGNNLKTCNNVIDHHKSDTEIEIFLTQQKYLLQGTKKKPELQAWFQWAASSRGYFLRIWRKFKCLRAKIVCNTETICLGRSVLSGVS